MFEKEKRKGVPTRGLLYLLAGVVIGVAGMMVIMMIVNRGVKPDPAPTSLPVIPTPAMGVTGTALAQTVPTAIPGKRLLAFTVDEKKDLMALSYEEDSIESVVQVRPWSAEKLQKSWVTLERSTTDYNTLVFDPKLPNLMATSNTDVIVTSFFDLNTNQRSTSPFQAISYSPDGEWMASRSYPPDNSTLVMGVTRRAPGSPVTILQTQGVSLASTFSPDSQMIAVIGLDDESYGKEYGPYVKVFRLSDLTLLKSYTFDVTTSYLSHLVFSPDNIHMAVGVGNSVRVLSLNDDEQRYFDTVKPVEHIAIDPTGKWLAILGDEREANDRIVSFYPLGDSNPLAPVLAMTQNIRMNDDVVGLQFVEEGLLVGEAWGNITLYRWNGNLWHDPAMIMENFE